MANVSKISDVSDDDNMSSVAEMSKVGIVENNYIPYKGMVFDNDQVAYEFYNSYSEIVGFSVRIQAARKNKDGQWGTRIYVCSREGFRRPDKRQHLVKKPRAETRTGCGATMKIKLERFTRKYVIYGFTPEHNHEVTRPDLANMVPSQLRFSVAQSEDIELEKHSGIAQCDSYELMRRKIGGTKSFGFLNVDSKNCLRTKRQSALPYGEAGSILKYFQYQQARGHSIFYALQLDCEEKITNIFWADAQMRNDYGYFGEAVSFDTTYKLHRDSRPFVVFSGFNHHREGTIFGAALMYDETVDSYTWLFETFLQAMSNKHPKTIFTDQAVAIAKALAQVMPKTFHRLCRWHALQEVHYNFMDPQDEDPCNVLDVLGPFFDEPQEEDEWLGAWDAMLDEFDARENTWLKMIFDLRRKWAPPYVRWHWLAGMHTTQLIKSTDADLNGCIRREYGISQFFAHFESLLEGIRDKEYEADYGLSYELPEDKVPVRFLQHASQIYTKEIFDEIREQFIVSLETDLVERGEEGGCQFFIISPPPGQNRSHRVTREGTNMLSCTCRLFNMQGILCGHMIKVLREVMCIHEIPSYYILKRWTKEARFENVSNTRGCIVDSEWKKERILRYEALNSLFHKIICKSCETEETFEVTMKQATELLSTIEGMLRNVQVSKPNHSEAGSSSEVGSAETGSECINAQAKGVARHAPMDPVADIASNER